MLAQDGGSICASDFIQLSQSHSTQRQDSLWEGDLHFNIMHAGIYECLLV